MTYNLGLRDQFSGVGPYSYRYKGFGPGACCPDPAPCCDVDFVLDYGTRKYVTIDWSQKLSRSGECKVLNSTWHLVENASENLKFEDQLIESGIITKIMVSGGVFGGEYKIVNKITTEEGTTHKCVVCITVRGCLTGGTIMIGDACNPKPVACHTRPLLPCENDQISIAPEPLEKSIIESGIYTRNDILNKLGISCIKNITFVLIEGSALYIDGTGSWPIESKGTTVDNCGQCLEDFVINVSEGSSIFFTHEGQ